jgi:hypothetical protein
MSASDRYVVLDERGAEPPPLWWLTDLDTVSGEEEVDTVGSVALLVAGHEVWSTNVLITEAVIVLTVASQDAAQVVARVLAALNGGDQ